MNDEDITPEMIREAEEELGINLHKKGEYRWQKPEE
ncbi:hypothetical protein SAMN06295933_0271 [Desulfovibrio gilichinskyi]|uniref:Uncharacterized protein n=1 Tax=Desulfovibrio gilichinskyi TaxID=1519643 RepID=A0A1X7C494_9BACT|nr:hypothetical protein SAMN06295933_0271 [Desulfovibrio gilichinskyi]